MKSTLFLALLAAVALLAWRTTPPDANAPAQLDSPTPAVQGDMKLVAISRGDRNGNFEYRDGGILQDWLADLHLAKHIHILRADTLGSSGEDATGLWITMPAYPSGTSLGYTATARSSTGHSTALTLDDTGGPTVMFLIPAGYPESIKYFDISATDDIGHTGHWRITHLPPMRHIVPSDTRIVSTLTADDLQLTFHAWHDDTSAEQAIEVGAFVAKIPAAALSVGLGDKPLQTELIHTNLTPDWVPNDYQWPTTSVPVGVPDEHYRRNNTPFFFNIDMQSPPFAQEQSRVQFNAALTTFDLWKEMVVFHNIPVLRGVGGDGRPFYYANVSKSLSAVTPSGVQVTLPAQGRATVPGDSPYSHPLLFRVSLTSQRPLLLPKSPLCQRYRKPMTASLAPFLPGMLSLYEPATSKATIEDYDDGNPHATGLHDLPVVVWQRVDVQTTPMATFTLPIEQRQPTTP